MEKTVFQKIIDRELPANIIYEDNKTIAILDRTPTNKGHTLVIPKHPYRDIYEIKEEAASALLMTTSKLAKAVEEATEAIGTNIIINNGAGAGQVVFHLHIHIIPRYTNDGHKLWQPNEGYSEGEAEEYALKIKKFYRTK